MTAEPTPVASIFGVTEANFGDKTGSDVIVDGMTGETIVGVAGVANGADSGTTGKGVIVDNLIGLGDKL